MPAAANLYVVSGGPGSGKTTLLRELARLGFPHAPEVARQIIQEQMRTGGRALPWDDREAYTALMLRRSIESYWEHAASAATAFADRGIPDTLAYARLIGLADTIAIETACREYGYASLVFLAPPWRKIYATDAERKQDFAEALRTYDVVASVYRELNYEVVELPKEAPAERAQFVIAHLAAGGAS